MYLFYISYTYLVVVRILELEISKKNEKWLIENGAIEFGKSHYKYILLLHIIFYISLLVEFNFYGNNIELKLFNYFLFGFSIILQFIRFSLIKSLGKFWNTKIFRIPGTRLIKTGLYKRFNHPNYIIVILEIVCIPLIFSLYITAITFSLINLILLSIRIKEENRALRIN
jgi:methyltransferase